MSLSPGRLVILAVVVAGLAGVYAARAQQEVNNLPQIQWNVGPASVKMRHIGQLEVPKGYKFTGEAGTASIMRMTKNPVNPAHMGTLVADDFAKNPATDWFLIFTYEDIGKVSDAEKANLDADAIMKNLQSIQEQANKNRSAQGFPPLTLVGWEQKPFYDPQSNNLTWGTRVRSSMNGVVMDDINYNSCILGRAGVVSANLVVAPEMLQSVIPKYNEILKGYSFQSGQKYSEWRAGDKVAAVGLTALISGGVVAAAAKSGILGKLGKFIIYIVIIVVAAIGGLMKKIFGGGSKASPDSV